MLRSRSPLPQSILSIVSIFVCVVSWGVSVSAAKERIHLIWSVYDGGTKTYTDSLQKAFNEAHSEIELQLTRVDWNDTEQVLLARVSAKQEPHLAIIPSYKVAYFKNLELLEPIGPYLSQATIDNFTFAKYLDNQLYGAPMASGVRVLYYRKDLIPHPPKTFEEMREMALAIHDPPNVYGIGLVGQRYKENVDFAYYLFGNGGDYFAINADGSYGKSTVNSPEGIEALTFMNDLVHKYKVTQPDVHAYGRDEVQALFVSGKLGFFINNSATATLLEQSQVPFEWGVTSIPSFEDSSPRPLEVSDTIIQFKRPGHFKAIGTFLDFFYQDQWRFPLDKAIGFPPVTKSLADHPSFQKPVLQAMLRYATSAKSYPAIVDWTAMNDILWEEFERVFLGYQTPEMALALAALKIDQLRGIR